MTISLTRVRTVRLGVWTSARPALFRGRFTIADLLHENTKLLCFGCSYINFGSVEEFHIASSRWSTCRFLVWTDGQTAPDPLRYYTNGKKLVQFLFYFSIKSNYNFETKTRFICLFTYYVKHIIPKKFLIVNEKVMNSNHLLRYCSFNLIFFINFFSLISYRNDISTAISIIGIVFMQK